MSYKYEMQELLASKENERTFKITVRIPPDELGVYHKTIISGLLLSLLEIMEESNDPATRDRLDEEIKEVMKELNLTWEDIG